MKQRQKELFNKLWLLLAIIIIAIIAGMIFTNCNTQVNTRMYYPKMIEENSYIVVDKAMFSNLKAKHIIRFIEKKNKVKVIYFENDGSYRIKLKHGYIRKDKWNRLIQVEANVKKYIYDEYFIYNIY